MPHPLHNQIVRNLIPAEPAVIQEVKPIGAKFTVKYIGVNSRKANNKILTQQELEALEVLSEEGVFNFQGDPDRFKLFAEAERIHSAHQFDPLFAVNCSIVDPLPHQVEAVYRFLLPMPKIRFLLADDTGAGKTIMTGLLLKELMIRGIVEKVLIVTPGGLTKQWQEEEMGTKFNLPFTLVNRSRFVSDPNVFETSSHVVASIDFICREDVLQVLSNTLWDLVVFDEAHKLSAYDYGSKVYKSKRYLAAQALAKQSEHLLLLTATPHRGRVDTFKKLLQLLDEDIFATEDLASARVQELGSHGLNKFFIRRLKEDMRDWDGKPLYKPRHTKTVAYQLTEPEKQLYDAVTKYLTQRKAEASEARNIHVALALTVLQRRLASSIFAIKKTLHKRWTALNAMIQEAEQNPKIWQQRHRLDEWDFDTVDDYDDLSEEERETLDAIISDPKKLRLFTTASDANTLREEAQEVKRLFQMADDLYRQNQEEKKFQELRKLLREQGKTGEEKLVIFTEHKDTLEYLQERLRNNGYRTATIHGGKSVDERRQAQWDFQQDAQILIATDAAGEGINLQFCHLLINWDIPWNPNRLEQRMGRIHRYGQQQEVVVFNMVASNTKEGQVLERLLRKLDIIRENIGDDRVYDVIQDVFEEVGLDAILGAVYDGKKTAFTEMIDDDKRLADAVVRKIDENAGALAHGGVDYRQARALKQHSDQQRLSPIYVQRFFKAAFQHLGGRIEEAQEGIFRLLRLPEAVALRLKEHYSLNPELAAAAPYCFDKEIFLHHRQQPSAAKGPLHYINPGTPLFDALLHAARAAFKEDMLKGTVLVSPLPQDSTAPYWAYFVRSQIADERRRKDGESIADERIALVAMDAQGNGIATSPAKFLDLAPPKELAKIAEVPQPQHTDAVLEWSYEHITEPQFEQARERIAADAAQRRVYLTEAFTQLILERQASIQDLQAKLLIGQTGLQPKLQEQEERVEWLKQRRNRRLEELELMENLSPKVPEIMGCAYVMPLNEVEFERRFGMTRDPETEAIAMQTALRHELDEGWTPQDVSALNVGYDLLSESPQGLKRYIEVKGRADTGHIMLSENEQNRLAQLGNDAWLYIVSHCKTQPLLHRIQNPIAQLKLEKIIKGVQYLLPLDEWTRKSRE